MLRTVSTRPSTNSTAPSARSATRSSRSTTPSAGLQAQLTALIAELRERLMLSIDFRLAGPIDHAVPEPIAQHLAPVLREALTNVARHADAQRVEVDVRVDADVTVMVSDDGVGMPTGRPDRGEGLTNLAVRAGGRARDVHGRRRVPAAARCSPGALRSTTDRRRASTESAGADRRRAIDSHVDGGDTDVDPVRVGSNSRSLPTMRTATISRARCGTAAGTETLHPEPAGDPFYGHRRRARSGMPRRRACRGSPRRPPPRAPVAGTRRRARTRRRGRRRLHRFGAERLVGIHHRLAGYRHRDAAAESARHAVLGRRGRRADVRPHREDEIDRCRLERTLRREPRARERRRRAVVAPVDPVARGLESPRGGLGGTRTSIRSPGCPSPSPLVGPIRSRSSLRLARPAQEGSDPPRPAGPSALARDPSGPGRSQHHPDEPVEEQC